MSYHEDAPSSLPLNCVNEVMWGTSPRDTHLVFSSVPETPLFSPKIRGVHIPCGPMKESEYLLYHKHTGLIQKQHQINKCLKVSLVCCEKQNTGIESIHTVFIYLIQL